jgi:hypothetical protein
MKSSRGLWFALAAACALGASAGCYTMLKHPRLQTEDRAASTENHYYDGEAVTFADDCASCHSTGSLRAYHRAVPPPRRYVSPTWDYYYDYPWWIPYYASGSGNAAANASEDEQKKRPFDRRRQSRPEEPAPSSSASTPASTTPAPATVAKPADSGAPANTPTKSADTNKREERDSGQKPSGERRTRKP